MLSRTAAAALSHTSARLARFSTVRYHETGPPQSVLCFEEEDQLPPVGANMVKIQMLAAPINPADLNMVEGGYGMDANVTFPAVGGNEGLAVVTQVGRGVKALAEGDHVIPHNAAFGTWRHFAVTPEAALMRVPKELPVEIAATLAVNPCTAYRLLADFVDLQAGDVIVQNGANSSVGQAVVQLAAHRGIRTINIMRHGNEYEEMHERLMGLGAEIVCTADYLNSSEFRRLVADLPAPKLGLNCIGGADGTNVARVLGKGATYVTYGGMSRKPVTIPTSLMIFNDLTCRGFWMTEWVKNHSAEERMRMLEELADLAMQGKLVSWVEQFDFKDFSAALDAVKERSNKRKVLLTMGLPDLGQLYTP